ncbi:hypothetical protein LBA_01144 [Megavirus lba]|uniref:Uncharacterized protein n=1 Tax=Megavirus lba TaxID=1235314 RepID=L7Y4I9_9VIRU|nr:hypothetical protein LBA_01144 [Megavirus lba]
MVLSDFISVRYKGLYFPHISCHHDPNHKTFSVFAENTYPTERVDNSEALSLIKKARTSFACYTKIKDKYMAKNYKKDLSPEQIKKHFYKSHDKKFYCIYFDITNDDAVLYYVFGIIEISTGKHLLIVREFWSGSYDALYIKHHMFDYYTGDDYLEDTCYPNPRTIISYDTNEKFDNHHKPFDIIDSLEDYFYTLFDELSELVQ